MVGHEGGKQPATFIFRRAGGTWVSAPPLPGKAPSRWLSAVLPAGQVVLLVAYDFDGVGKLRAVAFDPARNAWQEQAPLAAKYASGLVALPDGGLLVAAGYDQLGRYDGDKRTWSLRKWEGHPSTTW